MAAQRKPHHRRSVHSVAFSVQDSVRSKGDSDPSSCLDQDRGDVGRGERVVCRGRPHRCTDSRGETGLDSQEQGAAQATNLFGAVS